MKKFQVGPETVRMLQLGHPWVIADRYTKGWSGGAAGDLIGLVDERKQHLATALYDPEDRIVARVLSRGIIGDMDRWLADRFTEAQRLRVHALLADTDVYRLVNGEGDGLPGLTVDRYGDYLMVQLYTAAWDNYLDAIKNALKQVFQPRGIYRKLRPQETRALEAKSRNKEYSQLIYGAKAPVPMTVRENGLNFLVDLREGLNTGIFPDQRRNRKELMAHVKGQTFLNLFAFTGAFSVAAASAGASCVTSVDVSKKYLDVARENFELNNIDPNHHDFIVGDVFSELTRMAGAKQFFDVILFDPPSFSTTKKSRFSTQGGTAKLVTATLPLLKPGGLLISSSNHQKVTSEDYLKELRKGALACGSDLKTIYVCGQPEDFPCMVSFPEGRYLKFVVSVKSS